MNTPNELYLPDGLVISPQELFNVPSRRSDALYNAIKHRLEAQQAVHADDLLQAAYFPHIFEEFLSAGWLTSSDVERALLRPDLRSAVLFQRYSEFAPLLEPALGRDLESIERIVVFGRRVGCTLLRSDAAYMRLLEPAPERFFRLFPDPAQSIVDRLLRTSIERKHFDPACAYFVLKLRGASALTPELISSLQSDDYHAYASAKLLRAQAVPGSVWSVLLEKLSQPRWIYHALRDLLIAPTPAISAALCRHPEWAVQWAVAKRASLDEVVEIYRLCLSHAMGHPLFSDLSLWYQRRQERHVRELSLAA